MSTPKAPPLALNFNDLLKASPIRTAFSTFRGLFGLELIVTSRDELEAANLAAQTQVLNRDSGAFEKQFDDEKFRAWLATRVASFKDLTIKQALTLCGRALPADLTPRANDPLTCEPETVSTLLNKVVGLQQWLINELGTIAIEAARQDRASQEN